MSLFAQ